EDASKELAIIEADYMAEYKLKKVISDEAVDAFCLKNTGHNVWPYWRELVSTTTQRLGLPNLTLPLQKPVKES
ncbi:protein-export chaperone SecB, partial [Staphylococcus aureus]|nr:protein-export chaperone SecB [Staphylococcus aureus]